MAEIVYEPFSSRPLSDFYEELSFEFPDLPTQLFDYYIVRTAITMAREGNLIRRTAYIEGAKGVTRYRLESPDGMRISAVMGVRIAPHCASREHEATRSFVAPAGRTEQTRDIVWFDPDENTLHVSPSYCRERLVVSLAVEPNPDACSLPEQFYSKFLPVLLMGTRANILLITGRPWSNLQLGQAYYNEFKKSIRAQSVEVATHKQRGAVKAQFGRVL